MHSITRPHPIWSAAGNSSFEINKCTILARLTSGRYRTEALARFWSENRQGLCLFPACNNVVGDLEYMLLHCSALHIARQNLLEMWRAKTSALPPLHMYTMQILSSPPTTIMSFILDPSSLPPIIDLYQRYGKSVLDIVFYITRTFVYGLHRRKLILLGKWPYSTKNENCYMNKIEQLTNSSVAGVPETGPDVPNDPPAVTHGADCPDAGAQTCCSTLVRGAVPGVPAAAGLGGTHHCCSDENSAPNVTSQPSIQLYSHDRPTDPPVPRPRECVDRGVADSDQLVFPSPQHVQSMQGGVCPGMSYCDDDADARDVNATDPHPTEVHSDGHLAHGRGLGGWRGGLACEGSVVERSSFPLFHSKTPFQLKQFS